MTTWDLRSTLVLGFSLGCVGASACRDRDAPDSRDASSTSGVVGVQTAVVQVRPFVETINATGTVEPRPGHYAELSAPAPTHVARIFVGLGDHVADGAPLVEFDRAPFDAAAASADATLANAQHAFDRATQLAAVGGASKKDVDQAAADLAAAQSVAVSAHLAQTRALLRSPVSGVVTQLSAVLGAPVDPNQPVVAVADVSTLDVVLTVPPSSAALVRPGATVAIAAGSDSSGEALGAGTVSAVSATVDSASRGVLVRVRVTHPTRSLRIGETVYAQVSAGVHAHAVTVPVQALVPEGEGFQVFVVGPDGLAHARAVTVGGRTSRIAEVTRGLEPNETVVTEGAFGMDDSVRVTTPVPRVP